MRTTIVDINSVKVTVRDIATAATAFYSVAPNPDPSAPLRAAAAAFSDPVLAVAAPLRFAAMLNLMSAGGLRGWFSDAPENEGIALDPAVIGAAIAEPLEIAPGGLVQFNAESFRNRVLLLSSPLGTA